MLVQRDHMRQVEHRIQHQIRDHEHVLHLFSEAILLRHKPAKAIFSQHISFDER